MCDVCSTVVSLATVAAVTAPMSVRGLRHAFGFWLSGRREALLVWLSTAVPSAVLCRLPWSVVRPILLAALRDLSRQSARIRARSSEPHTVGMIAPNAINDPAGRYLRH